jgi:ketosteroid isomerase-like protein
MSEENVELAKEMFEVWNRGDVEWLIAHTDAEVEIKSATLGLDHGSYRGHAGVRAWFADAHEPFEVAEPRIEEIRDLGDSVLAFGVLHWRGKESRIEMDEAYGWLWIFREGKILRMESFNDRAKALEAAGLSE